MQRTLSGTLFLRLCVMNVFLHIKTALRHCVIQGEREIKRLSFYLSLYISLIIRITPTNYGLDCHYNKNDNYHRYNRKKRNQNVCS